MLALKDQVLILKAPWRLMTVANTTDLPNVISYITMCH